MARVETLVGLRVVVRPLDKSTLVFWVHFAQACIYDAYTN